MERSRSTWIRYRSSGRGAASTTRGAELHIAALKGSGPQRPKPTSVNAVVGAPVGCPPPLRDRVSELANPARFAYAPPQRNSRFMSVYNFARL